MKWFKQTPLLPVPVHLAGWLLSLAALALDSWFFIAIDRNSHSVSDTLIRFFIYFTAVTFWWKWIADRTS